MGLFPTQLTGFFLLFSISIFIILFKYETIVRSSAWYFGHSDPDPSSVPTFLLAPREKTLWKIEAFYNILSDCHNSDEVNYLLNAFRFKKKSQNMFSYVTAAHAQIHGEAAVYVKVGSTISLTCTINLYSVPPPDITWYHGSKVCT